MVTFLNTCCKCCNINITCCNPYSSFRLTTETCLVASLLYLNVEFRRGHFPSEAALRCILVCDIFFLLCGQDFFCCFVQQQYMIMRNYDFSNYLPTQSIKSSELAEFLSKCQHIQFRVVKLNNASSNKTLHHLYAVRCTFFLTWCCIFCTNI